MIILLNSLIKFEVSRLYLRDFSRPRLAVKINLGKCSLCWKWACLVIILMLTPQINGAPVNNTRTWSDTVRYVAGENRGWSHISHGTCCWLSATGTRSALRYFGFPLLYTHSFIINTDINVWKASLKTKRGLLYLKTQFVPRSKHFSSRL